MNIVNAVLVLITVCSLVFTLFKTTEANMQKQLAIVNLTRALQEREAAKAARIEEERQMQIADECSRNKK